MTMDIVVDIQGFRDAEEKFIPKETAVVAINARIIGHWITLPPYSFDELPERSKRENNWLSQNYHGIEWFDGEANPKYFVRQLREITRRARFIYTRGQEKASYLSDLLSRNIYNLEADTPAFKNLPDTDELGHRCSHHGFRSNAKYLCALRNAYKLKRWLNERNKRSSNHTTLPFIKKEEEEEEEEEEEKAEESSQNVEVKAEVASSDEEKENHLFVTTSSKTNDSAESPHITKSELVLQSSHENASSTEQLNSTQTIPLLRSSPSYEFTGNFKCLEPSKCQVCRSLPSRPTTEDVDEIDSYRRKHG